MESRIWCDLTDRLRAALGPFDTFAVIDRTGRDRPGFNLLPIGEGGPLAFVKLRTNGGPIDNEYDVLERVSRFAPRTFAVPTPLVAGSISHWRYLVASPLPALVHRVPAAAPLEAVQREVEEALADLPRPEGTPEHWRPMHGDFTPWNLREYPDRGLVLVDWEDAAWGPPDADVVLYRATSAVLRGERAPTCAAAEATEFWIREFGRRDGAVTRDAKLHESVVDALRGMQR